MKGCKRRTDRLRYAMLRNGRSHGFGRSLVPMDEQMPWSSVLCILMCYACWYTPKCVVSPSHHLEHDSPAELAGVHDSELTVDTDRAECPLIYAVPERPGSDNASSTASGRSTGTKKVVG